MRAENAKFGKKNKNFRIHKFLSIKLKTLSWQKSKFLAKIETLGKNRNSKEFLVFVPIANFEL